MRPETSPLSVMPSFTCQVCTILHTQCSEQAVNSAGCVNSNDVSHEKRCMAYIAVTEHTSAALSLSYGAARTKESMASKEGYGKWHGSNNTNGKRRDGTGSCKNGERGQTQQPAHCTALCIFAELTTQCHANIGNGVRVIPALSMHICTCRALRS